MSLRQQQVNKPMTHLCYHYFYIDNARQGETYVGAVWQDEEGKDWSAHCTTGVEKGLYGHLGDFDSQAEALDCLERRLSGDKTAKGRDAD